MHEKETLAVLEFHLCKQFLDKLLADGLITEKQLKRITDRVRKRIAARV